MFCFLLKTYIIRSLQAYILMNTILFLAFKIVLASRAWWHVSKSSTWQCDSYIVRLARAVYQDAVSTNKPSTCAGFSMKQVFIP